MVPAGCWLSESAEMEPRSGGDGVLGVIQGGWGVASSPGVSNGMHGCCLPGSSEATESLAGFL